MDTNNINTKIPGNKMMLIAGLVATGLIVGIWIWKSTEVSAVKKQSATAMQQLKDEMISQIHYSEKLYLKSIAKPFIWAIRSEMLTNNISQVNLYANEMVKEKNFQKVLVANDKGMVILSTNKKEEGKEFVTAGKINYLLSDTTVVENINDSLLIMSSPVMGFNNRIGTLIVTYSSQHPDLK